MAMNRSSRDSAKPNAKPAKAKPGASRRARKPPSEAPRAAAPDSSTRAEQQDATDVWNLRLYIAGDSPKSKTALANLQRLCESHLDGKYHIEVVDLKSRPDLAKADQILALPTIIRKIPEPMKRIIGDLSNAERALIGLDLPRSKQLGANPVELAK
jgi:circadian clock protein KaiB